MITGPGQDWTYTRQAHLLSSLMARSRARCDISYDPDERFTEVGPSCDLSPYDYVDLLFKTLKIGFRLAWPGRGLSVIRLDHTSHHGPVFNVAFSSDDDEVIADAVCAWVTDIYRTPAGSLARHFADRVERTTPFSPRLRQMGIHAIRRIWSNELSVAAFETVRLLNRLEADAGEVEEKANWAKLLVGVIRSPLGFESLSSHNWRSLGKLAPTP